MSIQSVSFWQQDQTYWSRQQSQSQSLSASNTLISDMAQVMVNQSKGLSSIANKTALSRVNSQISALVQSALQPSSGGSTSSLSTGSSTTGASSASASSSAAAAAAAQPASGTGTAPVTTATSLSILGILPKGTITVSDGTNTTTYTSTGSDTIGSLLQSINSGAFTNANVTLSLNRVGQLVFTAKNTTDTITVGGSGNDAAAIGFGGGNNTFAPTTGSANASGSAAASSGSTASTASTPASQFSSVLTRTELNTSSAAAFLTAAATATGSSVNLLA